MAKRRELGRMSLDERRMAIITAVTVALWVTQSLHGMPPGFRPSAHSSR